MKFFLFIAALVAVAAAQHQQNQKQQTTPVPILKQINKHNEDGSYSYGYEGADGSYKIESKYPNGEVYGKYGYVDDSGKTREIEYGASRRGFEPAGANIMVPPPTINNNQANVQPLGPNQEDDGQYREDPSVYYKDDQYNSNNNQQKPASTPFRFNQVNYQQPQQQQQQQYQQPKQQQYQQYQQPQQQQSYQPAQQSYHQPRAYQQPQQSYRPQTNYNSFSSQPAQQYQQPKYSNPAHPNFDPYAGHPASNFDVASGSYSVNYKR